MGQNDFCKESKRYHVDDKVTLIFPACKASSGQEESRDPVLRNQQQRGGSSLNQNHWSRHECVETD